MLIRTCGDLGIPCERIPSLTGVWTQSSPPAKIAAIGVHISRAVTSHGFALNLSTDLDYFKLIIPCGIADKPVTSIAHELEHHSRPLPTFDSARQPRLRQLRTRLPAADPLVRIPRGPPPIAPANYPDPEDTPARAPEPLRRLHQQDTHLA